MARPTLLTDKRAQAIADATRAGAYTEVAAQMAGISHSTYFLWLAKGKRDLDIRSERDDLPDIDESHEHEFPNPNDGACWCGHTRYSQFVERLKAAEAAAEVTAIAHVRAAWGTNWQAAMTYLERRFPQRWSRRDRLAVSTDVPDEETSPVEEMTLTARVAETLAILDRADRLRNGDSD